VQTPFFIFLLFWPRWWLEEWVAHSKPTNFPKSRQRRQAAFLLSADPLPNSGARQ